LLHCSLASRADQYPSEIFELMLLLGHETKALGLAELLTRLEYKHQIFILIARHLATQPEREHEAMQLFTRAEQMVLSIPDGESKARTLIALGTALAQAGQWQEAERILRSISSEWEWNKVEGLMALGTALAEAGQWQEAERVVCSISDKWGRSEALMTLGTALAQAGYWQEAERIVLSNPDEENKIQALSILIDTLAQHNEYRRIVRLVQREWLRTMRRDEALALVPLAFSLIPRYPDLGMALYEAFAWVDKFLQG
jgi:tetratricopeptide (TPR) repeat protein